MIRTDHSTGAAERILTHWKIDASIALTHKEAFDSSYSWLEKTWPSASVACEVPMTLLSDHGECYQGYNDLIIETPRGYVIVDHKTHDVKSDDPEEVETRARDYASRQAGQLRIYRRAVEQASDQPVLDTFIHFPVLGRVYRVDVLTSGGMSQLSGLSK